MSHIHTSISSIATSEYIWVFIFLLQTIFETLSAKRDVTERLAPNTLDLSLKLKCVARVDGMDTMDSVDGSHSSDTFYFVVNYINYGISIEKKSDNYSGHKNIYITYLNGSKPS